MKTRLALITGASLFAATVATGIVPAADDTTGGPLLGPQTALQPELGEQGEFDPPPAPGLPSESETQPVPQREPQRPAETQPAVPPADPAPQNLPPQTDNPREEAISTVVKAQELIGAERYDEAIDLASRSINLDPENAAAYKKVRASAYQRLGRYSEALADRNPLEVTVVARRAELKSKSVVIDVVSGGTTVLVGDVQGNWLKVIAAGDQTYEWAWIHRRDVSPDEQSRVDSPRLPARIEYNIPSYQPVPTGRRRVYIYLGGRRVDGNYGRDYYDYWRHVPPQYWHHLPQ